MTADVKLSEHWDNSASSVDIFFNVTRYRFAKSEGSTRTNIRLPNTNTLPGSTKDLPKSTYIYQRPRISQNQPISSKDQGSPRTNLYLPKTKDLPEPTYIFQRPRISQNQPISSKRSTMSQNQLISSKDEKSHIYLLNLQ